MSKPSGNGKIFMAISLQNKKSLEDADVKSIACRLLSMPITDSKRIGGGLNSRVYQIKSVDNVKYVLKFYYCDAANTRDRLTVEFSSLSFLWNNGLRSIPQPITMDKDGNCAIYTFIEGKKISPEEIKSQDIVCALEFLADLKRLRGVDADFPRVASEAFFSVQEINDNIQARVNRLKEVKEPGEEYEVLRNYLDCEFIPFWEILIQWAKKRLSDSRISFDESISEREKILSPSDFGFHNALRDKSGRIVFLDFEHFGWDDPAKTISDFLLHPAMMLDRNLKQQFVTSGLKLFKECERLKDRIKVTYPFFGLKWCLIFLNEFIPGDFQRRHFAQIETLSKNNILKKQLLKAKNMLVTMKDTYSKFPYDTLL